VLPPIVYDLRKDIAVRSGNKRPNEAVRLFPEPGRLFLFFPPFPGEFLLFPFPSSFPLKKLK